MTPTVTFVAPDGAVRAIGIAEGVSVMEGAVAGGIDGILADCGGACACATCHVHVNPAWIDRLPPMAEDEEAMLEMAIAPDETSRLSCQIRMTASLDGLTLRLPERQF